MRDKVERLEGLLREARTMAEAVLEFYDERFGDKDDPDRRMVVSYIRRIDEAIAGEEDCETYRSINDG